MGFVSLALLWLLNDMVSFTVITGNERTLKIFSNYIYRRLLQMKYVYTCRPFLNKLINAYYVVSFCTVCYGVLSVVSLFTLIRGRICVCWT